MIYTVEVCTQIDQDSWRVVALGPKGEKASFPVVFHLDQCVFQPLHPNDDIEVPAGCRSQLNDERQKIHIVDKPIAVYTTRETWFENPFDKPTSNA